MSRLGKWLLGSCCLHLLMIGGVAVLCAVSQKPAAVIDLSQLGHSWQASAGSGVGGLQQEQAAAIPEPVRRHEKPRIRKPQKPKPAARMRPSAKSVQPAPQQAIDAVAGEDNASIAADAAGGLTGARRGGSDESGSGGAGGGAGSQNGAYRGMYFGFITRLVQKAAVYPLQARRMGWQGTVTVSFVIQKNGSITDAAVIESSGKAVLDGSALTAVKKIGPLPGPLETVEIRLPVIYRLNKAG
ncbi:MAG: energy transducer TonB [Deltaproteobacteria bacterium]|nr:energy transducer TonB [Deltaproteobacteria bacterium]